MISDIISICGCRLKLIFKSMPVKISFAIAILITAVMVNVLLDSAEEKSSIPIGIVDEDNSDKSKQVIENLYDTPSLYVKEGDYNSLLKELVDSNIYVIIKINKGFSENLNGDNDIKLLNVYYVQGNKNMSIISDIVLSKVMDEVCYNSCLKTYKGYEKKYKIMSDEEYEAHSNDIKSKYKASLNLSYEVVNISSNQNVKENVTNGLLYRLVVIGIMTVLIAFIVLFAANNVILDKVHNTDKRIRISYASTLSKTLGDVFALFITSELYVIISSVLIFGNFGISSFKEVITLLAGLTLFSLATSAGFIIITLFIRESVMLQIIGAFYVCISGIVGSFEIISVILPDKIARMANLIPNVYVVKIYNKLAVLGNADNEVIMLAAYTVIILTVMVLLNLIKEFIYKNKSLRVN